MTNPDMEINSMSQALAAQKRLRDRSVANFKEAVRGTRASNSVMASGINMDIHELSRVLEYLEEHEALVHMLTLSLQHPEICKNQV